MKKLLLPAIFILVGLPAYAQKTVDTKDWQVAKQRWVLGNKYYTQVTEGISGSSTHIQSPTAKAVWDLVQSLIVIAAPGPSADAVLLKLNNQLSNPGTVLAGQDGVYAEPYTSGYVALGLRDTSVQAGKLARSGADPDDILQWDGWAWGPAPLIIYSAAPLDGGGTAGDPVTFAPGTSPGQVWKWNGTAWALAPDAGVFVDGTASFTPGATTAAMGGTLPPGNENLWVYRNGLRYIVGAPGCGSCNVTRSGSTLTFARAIASGEKITFKHPTQ